MEPLDQHDYGSISLIQHSGRHQGAHGVMRPNWTLDCSLKNAALAHNLSTFTILLGSISRVSLSIRTYMHTCMHAYIHAYIHACIHTYMYTCIHVYKYVSLYLSIYLPTYLSIYRPNLSIYLSFFLSIQLPIYPDIYLIYLIYLN